jgi:antirestriction protein ArdC
MGRVALHCIVADLERGIRTWMKPWSVEHTAGRITKPLRHNGTPYWGMNILLLWGAALSKGYAAPIWMTYKQAQETGGQVRKGEHGSLVVYANSVTKTETNEKGEDTERDIPFMKAYTVFNVEQVDGLPAHYYAQPANPLPLSKRIENADRFMSNATPARPSTTAATGPFTHPPVTRYSFRPSKPSKTRRAITPPPCTS